MKKTKNILEKFILLMIFLIPLDSFAGIIKGVIKDKKTKENLIGASVQIIGTNLGSVSNLDGDFILNNIEDGTYDLLVRYVGYNPLKIEGVKIENNQTITKEILLESKDIKLGTATITAQKKLETERALINERKLSATAIENIGSREMGIKGISNAADGVKKLTSISFEKSGQVFVRGLGDRYSTTTLNGLPIASPNPDHKLIPLELFPSATIENISVSKVYEAHAFADYSGAHINISTKETVAKDFFSIAFAMGGQINALSKDFYSSNKQSNGILKSNNLSNKIKNLSIAYGNDEWSNYILHNDPFGTSFSVEKNTTIPDFSGTLAFGKNWHIKDNNKLSLIASTTASNKNRIKKNVYDARLRSNGDELVAFNYDNYTKELNIAGLASLNYIFNNGDKIKYSFFYTRNAVDDYKNRSGHDDNDYQLVGSNSSYHVYRLINNQISGKYSLSNKLFFKINGSFTSTASYEPDRRQLMFRIKGDDKLHFFTQENRAASRYFGELKENESVGNGYLVYKFNEKNKLRLGFTYKNKLRDYSSISFHYDLMNYADDIITDIFNVDDVLNTENVQNGNITISKLFKPLQSYHAGSEIYASYLELDYNINKQLLLNLGLRYENVNQWVKYWNDGALKDDSQRSEINKGDLFPALNLKYNIRKQDFLRFSISRTITRPSFIEMAPFLYNESYGGAEIRGNEKLENAYNYNFDLRYEKYFNNGQDLFSLTAYYKYLEKPIEQYQTYTGGSPQYTFFNADNGMATGIELEIRKTLSKRLRANANFSYMYTNIKLPTNGGNYSENNRALQGASPYLANLDVTYLQPLKRPGSLYSLALIYNIQGPRISSIGSNGSGNVKQTALNMLNFVGTYSTSSKIKFKLKINNLINSKIKFKQEVVDNNGQKTGEKALSQSYKSGINAEIGISYNF